MTLPRNTASETAAGSQGCHQGLEGVIVSSCVGTGHSRNQPRTRTATPENSLILVISGYRYRVCYALAPLPCAFGNGKAFLRRLNGKTSTRMPRWTDAELERLKVMYSDHSNLEIATALNRSVKSVVSKAHNLGLKKDLERLREMGRENVSLRYRRGPKV